MLKSLFKPKWQHKSPSVRIQAISRMQAEDKDHQGIIKQLLQQDPDLDVRIAAAQSCLDITLLNQLLNQAEESLATVCIEQTCGLLMAPPANTSDEQVLDFIAQQADVKVLQHLVEFGHDSKLGSEALLHIKDQHSIAHLSQHGKSRQLRQTAAQLLNNPELIQQVLSQSKGKDKKVTQVLKDKIKQLKLENQQLAANQNAIDDVLSKLQLLAKTEHTPQLSAKLSLLKQQWQTLSPSTEQQKDFDQSENLCQQRIEQQAQLDAQAQAHQEQQHQAHTEQQSIVNALESLLGELTSEDNTRPLADHQRSFEQQQNAWSDAQSLYPAKPQIKLSYTHFEQQIALLLPALERLTQKQAELDAALKPNESQKLDYKHQQKALSHSQKLINAIAWPKDISLPHSLRDLQGVISQQKQALLKLEQQQQQIKHNLEQQLKQLEQHIEAGHVDQARATMSKVRQNHAKLDPKHSKALQHSLHQAQQKLNELKDWQQFATGPKREALCQKMEQLAESQLPPHAQNQAIKELQQSWRQLGNDQHGKSLWQRFKKASDEAYAPCKAEFDKEKALRLYNGQQRSEICQQLESYLQQVDFNSADFNNVDTLYRHAADEWKRFSPVERSEHKALQARFNESMGAIKQALQQHKSDNIAAKQALVEQAKELINSEDCQQAINEAKQLQQQWKAIGISFHKQNQQLWGEFRLACDALFERRNQEFQTAKGEREQNQQKAEHISATILELSQADGEELQKNQKAVQQLIQDFNNLGALPKQHYQALKSQFQTSVDTFKQRVKGIAERQQQQALQVLINSADQLDQIESAAPTERQSLAASFIIPPELPELWQNQLNQRLQTSLNTQENSDLKAFELLCIKLEIVCDRTTPSEYQQQRMQYQMQQLSESFGNQAGKDLHKHTSELIIQWCQLSTPANADYHTLKQRFFSLAQEVLKAS